jgi:orotidine-5'-phosphate decarboxylase
VNNSRGIIFAYQQKPYAERYGSTNWQQAVEAATKDMIEQLRTETPAGKLAKP